MEVHGSGPSPAKVMIVGEAPDAEEERTGQSFMGAAGYELNKMLSEAGLSRGECFVTNVCRHRPPGNDISLWISANKRLVPGFTYLHTKQVHTHIAAGFEALKKEILAVQPNLIIACGNLAMYALTKQWGITDWRGSQLYYDQQIKVIPTYHPAAVLRQYSWRSTVIHDLRRAAREAQTKETIRPEWRFLLRPNIQQVLDCLHKLHTLLDMTKLTLSFDLETRSGHIACAGIAWSKNDAICIPFMCVENSDGYWSEEEETVILRWLRQVLQHPNAQVIGQNLLYDAQYTYRWWHFIPRVTQDTMISHHTAFCELPKALDYQASIYCQHYVYWKEDSKNWDPKIGELQLWRYNCEDAVRTYEVAEKTMGAIRGLQLDGPHDIQQKMFWPVLLAMTRGVRIDLKARNDMAAELLEALCHRELWLSSILGHDLNPRSPKQMQSLFYTDLQQKPIISRKTGRPSLDDEALDKLQAREPILRPIVSRIREMRSLGVFLGTFVNATLDTDQRMRCAYNICGTLTFRLSSRENAFGSGTNLQNIPKGDDIGLLPNIRKLFIPDPGFTFFDLDLDRADLQVVVWEADDAELKQMLREGVDLHSENAKTLGVPRQLAKMWVHGSNYGGSPRTMSANCGIPVHQAEQMRARWFSAHPGIASWHKRTEDQLFKRRFIENRFGYRWYVFDRPEGLLPEALAWQPQSTVGLVINRAWQNLFREQPLIQVLLQVHDSLAGQFPTDQKDFLIRELKRLCQITIPYSDPLVIPVGIKTSEKSWGDCVG